MTTLIILFLTQLVYIASRAFQQLNVMHHKVVWVYATSFFMAICEVTIFGALGARAYYTFTDGITAQSVGVFALAALPLWLGGSIGTHTAMTIHRRYR
jgi:hypothetical protein